MNIKDYHKNINNKGSKKKRPIAYIIKDQNNNNILIDLKGNKILQKDKEGDYVNSYMFDRSKYFQRYRWEEAFDWVEWLNSGRVILK